MFKTVADGSDIFHVCEQHPACTENTGCKNRALFSGYQHTEDWENTQLLNLKQGE